MIWSGKQLAAVIKTNLIVWNFLFSHIYGSISCLKLVADVTWTIIVAAISDNDWQPSWILRRLLMSKSFVTNLLRFLALEIYIYRYIL